MRSTSKIKYFIYLIIPLLTTSAWAGFADRVNQSRSSGSSHSSGGSERSGNQRSSVITQSHSQTRSGSSYDSTPQRSYGGSSFSERVNNHRSTNTLDTMSTRNSTTRFEGRNSRLSTNSSNQVRTQSTRGYYNRNERINQYHNERSFVRNSRTYVQRTYYHNNVSYVRYYHPYYWGSRPIYVYAPYRYYNPYFYGWVERPWAPVTYSWSWYNDPWYGYYDYYWRPYTVYYGPSYWITDYVISDMLADEYERGRNESIARENATAQAIIDENIKAQVRQQVEAEMKAHQKKESVPINQTLKPNYLYVVSEDMNVSVEGADESCALTSGDIIKILKTPGANDEVVNMSVVTAKKGSCAPNKHIIMSFEDLQSMKNNFSASVDKGLSKLSEQQGKNGIPAAPQEAQAQPEEIAPPAETTTPPTATPVTPQVQIQTQPQTQLQTAPVPQTTAPQVQIQTQPQPQLQTAPVPQTTAPQTPPPVQVPQVN